MVAFLNVLSRTISPFLSEKKKIRSAVLVVAHKPSDLENSRAKSKTEVDQ